MDYSLLLRKQKDFYLTGTTHNISFRKQALSKLQSIIRNYESQIYEAIYLDFHKSPFDTYATEISMINVEIKYFLRHLKHLTQPKHKPTNLANIPGHFSIVREPYGNILIIGAWNYPYQLTLLPAIAAIAAGNTCIIKPSELPSHTMQLLAELINANFPHEFLYVVTGDAETTSSLLQLNYDKIFFTGSPKVGQIVYQAAAKHLTPVVLELGGKSPVIVTRNADLKIAAKRIIWGKFLNAGQTCVAPDYIYAEQSIITPLLECLKNQIIQNNYTDGSQQYVSIINSQHFNRITQLINSNQVYYGGHSNPHTLYIEPTLLTSVSWNDPIMQEEIFGPLLPILSYNNFQDVITTIQHQPKPLAAYLFSNSINEQQQFLSHISAGGCCINDTIMHITSTHVPFGGVGNSGIGNYHGEAGFDCFSHHKTIFRKPLHLEPNIKYPPYSNQKLKWIKRLM